MMRGDQRLEDKLSSDEGGDQRLEVKIIQKFENKKKSAKKPGLGWLKP